MPPRRDDSSARTSACRGLSRMGLPPNSASGGPSPSLRRHADEIRVELGCVIEVEAAQPGNPVRVDQILQAVLKHAIEFDQLHERQRQQNRQRQYVEGGADLRGRRHQAEGDQPAGHRGEEHARAPGGLRHRLRAFALEREMLGRDEGNARRGRLIAGASASSMRVAAAAPAMRVVGAAATVSSHCCLRGRSLLSPVAGC
jgi:hypothetical protein